MHSWTASDALKSACDKGHNWISTRANNYKSFKSGYNKIRPKLFPKGLSTFKKEHCRDENESVDRFLSNRARACSLDASFYAKNRDEINFRERTPEDERRSASSLEDHGLLIWNVVLKNVSPNSIPFDRCRSCRSNSKRDCDARRHTASDDGHWTRCDSKPQQTKLRSKHQSLRQIQWSRSARNFARRVADLQRQVHPNWQQTKDFASKGWSNLQIWRFHRIEWRLKIKFSVEGFFDFALFIDFQLNLYQKL